MEKYDGLISVEELRGQIDDPQLRVIDCRFDLFDIGKGRVDFNLGHIPGAVYAHLDDDLAAPVDPQSGRHPLPAVATLEATLRGFGISQSTQVVVYDGGAGALAARLWWMLHWLGHRTVAVLDGGLAAWQAAGLPVEQAVVKPPEGEFSARAEPGWVLGTAELEERLRDDTAPIVVDAREARRFLGEVEPIDTRAGHVPGAMNLPFAENLQADGHWRPANELRDTWNRLFDGEIPGEWAVMCGSGVTACHLALSAQLAGLPRPRLYVGSWSEWIRDPSRPVAP